MSDKIGLELLKAFVEVGPLDDPDDLPYCRYCGRPEVYKHESDCTWARARAYLRDQGVEVVDWGESR